MWQGAIRFYSLLPLPDNIGILIDCYLPLPPAEGAVHARLPFECDHMSNPLYVDSH